MLSGDFEREYATAVGARLREVRRQKSLSLKDAAGASNGEFKAAVLGAYERGTRVVSVPRLRLLAALYDVPVEELLPDDHAGALGDNLRGARPTSLRVNLTMLRESKSLRRSL